MEHREGSFIGPRNLNIYYQYWLPDARPRGVLMVVHGIAEHSGRYANIVNHLVPLGYAVCGFDNVGHGRSGGKRCHVNSFQDLTQVIGTYHDMVRAWHPDPPLFIYGHSLGGLILATHLLDRQADYAGAAFTAPSVKVPEGITSLTIAAGKVLSRLAPGFELVQFDRTLISRDPEVVQAYRTDPLVYLGRYTARMGAEGLDAMQRVSAEAEKIKLPVLIMHGSGDRLIDPAASQMLYDRVGSHDKTLKLYQGLYHEVHNEPERAEVLADFHDWLEAHLIGE